MCLWATSWTRFSRGSLLGEFRCVLGRHKLHLGVDNLTHSFSQKEIMDMECELLISNSKNQAMIALVKEKIGQISDGSSPHCASVLKLGLEKALELKKQKSQPPGVLLLCTNHRCGWWGSPVSYSSVGASIFCPNCEYCFYMQCASCRYSRSNSCTSCQGCGKRFV